MVDPFQIRPPLFAMHYIADLKPLAMMTHGRENLIESVCTYVLPLYIRYGRYMYSSACAVHNIKYFQVFALRSNG